MQGLHLNLKQTFIWASEENMLGKPNKESLLEIFWVLGEVSKMVYSLLLSVC